MVEISVLGFAAFVLASLVVGVRLLLLAGRTRELPELTIGLTLLLLGGIGSLLAIASQTGAERLGSALPWVVASGIFCINTGGITLWLFTWRTFRPTSRWALALVVLGGMAAVGGFAGHGLGPGFGTVSPAEVGIWHWIGFASRSLPFLWTSIEAWLYYRAMRRRARLGLAEPLVANRLLLWAMASACVFAIFAMVTVVMVGGRAPQFGIIFTLRSVLGLVTAGLVWLAFFPPRFYRSWFETPVSDAPGSHTTH